jgi:hypothetical protein
VYEKETGFSIGFAFGCLVEKNKLLLFAMQLRSGLIYFSFCFVPWLFF